MRNTAPRLRLFGGQRAARRLLALWGGAVLAAAAGAADRWAPRSPEEAVRTFRVEAGLRVEVVAAEPLVASPVAFVFEDARRLYVAEGRGYPGPVDNRAAPPEGRIALLEDRDGDGRFERRTEFAAGLTYPNGLALWRGGVVVTCAPDILYLRDTDGDGVADERSVWLTGFDTAKSTQLRTSHPTLGLDGKFYVTSGLVGGKVIAPLHPGRAPVVFAAADGRFDPATLVFEPLGGRGQFGLTFDGFGRRFVVSNRHPVMQVVLDPADLRRNPHLAFAETAQNVSKVEAEAKVWPLSRASVTADFMPALLSKPHAGTFTSACGTIVFGGTALGAERTGNVFVAEPAQNLVQRQILRPEVATFRAEVAQPGAEFLATDDVWFRPVFLGEGPDGALYVADMYRREIDHPVYVPQEARGRLDFESGKDRGRIYRVVKEGIRGAGRPTAPVPARPLLADLQAADGWTRSTAHRRLLEQPQPERTAELEKIVREAARPEARAASLWVLRAWDRLTVATLGAAAADRDAGVREQAVKLAGEPRGAQPVAADLLVAAARDESARVRFVAALALGSASDERATAALAAIAARDGDDKWTRAAVLSGVGGRLGAFRAVFSGAAGGNAAAERAVMEDVGRLAGAGGTLEEAREFLTSTLAAPRSAAWRVPAALGLAEGLRGRADFRAKTGQAPLRALLPENEPAARARLAEFFAEAVGAALDETLPAARRGAAVALLGHTGFEDGAARLAPLLDARQPAELQLQAVRALERAGEARGGEILVAAERWSRFTPQVREAVIAALQGKAPLARVLLAAVKRGDIKPAEIASLRRGQLMKHADAAVRAEATELFKPLEGGDRMAVYREYRDLLQTPGDATAGAAAFARACSACHTIRGAGGKVGPDLSGVRHQPADALLLHVLVPNYEVTPAYQAVSVTLQDGRTVSGWVAAETEGSLTLRTAFGTEETVLRRAVTALTAAGVSLMPDGLEQTMSKAELTGLIAYLKSEAPDAR